MSRLFTFLKTSPFPLPSILKPKSLFKNSPRASNSSPTPTPSPIPPFLKEFTYWSLIIASWIPASIFFQDHIAELHIINGASMYPFLNTGYNESLTRDVCLVDKRRKGRDLERGMLVSFRWALPSFSLFPMFIMQFCILHYFVQKQYANSKIQCSC